MREPAIARTTTSEENGRRSSSEPPPRPTMSTSPRRQRLAAAICAAMAASAPSPWTGDGSTTTSTPAERRFSTRRMSRMAAPVGDVTTAPRAGSRGRGRLRASSHRPSAASRRFRSAIVARMSPSPASCRRSHTSW